MRVAVADLLAGEREDVGQRRRIVVDVVVGSAAPTSSTTGLGSVVAGIVATGDVTVVAAAPDVRRHEHTRPSART